MLTLYIADYLHIIYKTLTKKQENKNLSKAAEYNL